MQVVEVTPQSSSGWQRIVTDDNEFSISMPLMQPGHVSSNVYLNADGAKVRRRRVFSGYCNRAVFVVEVYETSNPKRLLKDTLAILGRGYAGANKSIGDISVNGYQGKQTLAIGKDYRSSTLHLISKERLYVITVAAREESNPAIIKFLSSLKLGGATLSAGAQGVQHLEKKESGDDADSPMCTSNDAPVQEAYEEKSKALIVWKPEPEPSLVAGSGVVRLRLVLSASGKIEDIEVLKKLKGNATEKAI
jgi:hypothetical protein